MHVPCYTTPLPTGTCACARVRECARARARAHAARRQVLRPCCMYLLHVVRGRLALARHGQVGHDEGRLLQSTRKHKKVHGGRVRARRTCVARALTRARHNAPHGRGALTSTCTSESHTLNTASARQTTPDACSDEHPCPISVGVGQVWVTTTSTHLRVLADEAVENGRC